MGRWDLNGGCFHWKHQDASGVIRLQLLDNGFEKLYFLVYMVLAF